jgi:hypothetical protein
MIATSVSTWFVNIWRSAEFWNDGRDASRIGSLIAKQLLAEYYVWRPRGAAMAAPIATVNRTTPTTAPAIIIMTLLAALVLNDVLEEAFRPRSPQTDVREGRDSNLRRGRTGAELGKEGE